MAISKEETANAEKYFKSIVETVREPLLILNEQMYVISANPAFYRLFHVSALETEHKYIYELGSGQWGLDGLRHILEKVILLNEYFHNYEVDYVFPVIGHRVILLNGRKIDQGEGREQLILLAMEDITEQKNKESILASTLMLVDNSPDIIIRYDLKGCYLYVNKAAEDHLGKSRQEVIGKGCIDVLVPYETSALFQDAFRRILETKKRETIFVPFGNSVYQAVIEPEIFGGEITSFASYCRDMTNIRRTEEELRQSEEKYRTLVERANDGIIIIQDGIINYANSRMADLDGSSVEQLVGTAYTDHIYPSEIPKLTEMYRRRMSGDKVSSSYDTILRRRDGSPAPSQISAAIISYRGKPADLVIIHDISEMKKKEEILRRSAYELRTLVDNSPDLIFRVNGSMRYEEVNSAYERLTGIPKERFIGKTNEELGMPSQMVEFWQNALLRVLESGQEYSMEFEMTSLFGKRYFATRLIPEFIKSGRVETVLVIARDITDRMHAESQLRYVSFHDKVTGLYNRAFFEEELRRIDTERELPLSIIMGDINNLKLINDVFGHEEGDKLLKTISESLSKACRNNDIIARWGGDEFSIILPKTSLSTANEILLRINQISSESQMTAIKPSIALGISVKEKRDQNIYQVVRQAEQAMYDNKLANSKQEEKSVMSSLFAMARERTGDFDLHIDRGYGLARLFGKELGLDEGQMKSLLLLIETHDIGTALIPQKTLAKPSPLTQEEWEFIKRHSEVGARIVMAFPDTAKVSDEIISHHENWDGSGYPHALKGKDIPFLSRVFALIESYDVITHPRRYARTFTRQEAIEEIGQKSGVQFDPELTDIFINKVLK